MKLSCPLGHKCERRNEDNQVTERCRWYKPLAGQDPQTGEMMPETWDCAIAWQPILQVEMSRTNLGQTAALNQFRNEVVQRRPEQKKISNG